MGFNSLDKILDGGLYEGLYILGAVSSLGKTTLLLQKADQIAKCGRDVLIALQPCGMKEGESTEDNAKIMNKCKASTERKIEAVILKNRNGQTGTIATFKYYAMFNCFEELEVKPPEFEEVEGLPDWDSLTNLNSLPRR